jgi:hypothetical protein
MQEDWGWASFEQALRDWIATVAITEVEFDGNADGWIWRIGTCGYLEELRERSGSDWPDRFDAMIEPWDERFRAATTEGDVHFVPGYAPGWWELRFPRRWHNPDLPIEAADT